MLNYQVTFFADLFSAAILLLLLVSIIPSKQYRYNSTKALIISMAITFASILFDAFNYWCEGKPEFDTLHMWAMVLTLLSINFIETFVGVYINCYVNEHKKPGVHFTYRFSIITAIVEGCCFILTLVLCVTGQIFTLTDGHQNPGEMFLIPFALDALASVFMIGYVLSHTQFISRRDALTIMTVVVFTAAGYSLDGALPGYNFSVMFGMVAILLNYLLVKDREVMELRDEEDIRFRKRVQSVLALSDNFEIIFLVNLDNGKYVVSETSNTKEASMSTDFSRKEHFIERNKEFIMQKVHPDDRSNVLSALSIDFLTYQFGKSQEYTVSYRIVKAGREIWYKMRIRPERSWPDRHKVLIGIFNNDDEHRKEKQHEMELEKQLTRYDLVHSMLSATSWSTFFDADRKIYKNVYADEGMHTFTTIPTPEDPIGLANTVHPDDFEMLKQALNAAISDKSGKTPLEGELRLLSQDGSYHWYHSSGRTILNPDGSGEILGTNTNTDAEHEKKILETQREHDFKFMRFRADILDYIATHDSDPAGFFDFFGEKIIVGMNCDQIFYRKSDGYIMHKERDGISAMNHEICGNCNLLRCTSRNVMTKGEYCLDDCSSADESMRPADACPVKSLLGRIIYNEGKPTGYLAIQYLNKTHTFSEQEKNSFREIANILNIGFERMKATEIQQLDFERYRLVHDIVHSGMWSYRFNKNNEIYKTDYSDELLSIIGWDRAHMSETSNNFEALIHPDDYNRSVASFNAALTDRSCKTIFDCEYRMRNMNGEYHWFRSAGRTIRYQNGYGEFFGTHINIDADKKRDELQTAIERARDNAEAASAAKSAFLFNMSHDIRTPLNAIIGFTEMAMTHKAEQEKVDDYLTKVKSSSDYLLNIVNDVLDLSRIESGKTEIDENIYSIEEVAGHVSEINSLAAKAKNITFIHSLENCTKPYVFCDAVHIKQIVVNILNNAIKYTPAGGTIWHTVQEEQAENPDEVKVTITIKDNGIGMDPSFVSHIFEAFERAQNTTQSGIQGTGLGMSIVKRLTDLLGGTIDIDTAPGKGTTVSVSFTHKVASDEQIEEYKALLKQKEEAELKIDEEKLVGKRLLLVEDNELNREISEQILQERGLIIETAADGADALQTVKEKGVGYYDFILMDIQMPVMDGYESTREIRKLPGAEKLPIAAFSANAFEEDKKRSLEAGMNIHVAKPINIKELTRSLASLL